MDWITGLQHSLYYIETHLEEEISPTTLCQFTHQSHSYYQRLFHMTKTIQIDKQHLTNGKRSTEVKKEIPISIP